MDDDMQQAVRDVCLWLPEAEEYMSHGSPNYRVRGKTYATYVVNHHGDGRVALWLNAAAGSQESRVSDSPRHFFVPPYVGPRGWLGVHLDKGLSWQRIAALVREAYEKVAPSTLALNLGKTPIIKISPRPLSPSEKDPLQAPPGKALLKVMRGICLKFPESQEAQQFGYPVWQAGKRTFASARAGEGRLSVGFWVGVGHQQLLTADERYQIPAYTGHNGWIALDVTDGCDPAELRALALQSYRHFALKRMLQSLES